MTFPITHYHERINAIARLHARRGRVSDDARSFLLRLTDLDHGPTDEELINVVTDKLNTALVLGRVTKRLTT